MSVAWPATASILAASSGSGASRKVSHGVGLVQPIEMSWKPSRSSTLPSPKLTHGDCSMMSSISQMSSLPPLRMHGIWPPLSLPSAMSSQRAGHLGGEPLVDRALLLAQVPQLIRGDHGRVEAAVPDPGHHRLELLA